MRQIVLDTETTGIDPRQGHRIIEIGCVELVNRRLTGNTFHVYINPQRLIEQEAIEVHGITNEYLLDKPVFADIAADFAQFINGAQLVIHNAPFDVGFMDHEFDRVASMGGKKTADMCTVLDTLEMARQIHPGQKNNLDALCKRYGIDNSHRELHGALLDSEILADVYLMMTGGQTALNLSGKSNSDGGSQVEPIRRLDPSLNQLKVLRATADELAEHEKRLDLVTKEGGSCLWRE
ncbi:DNA polymerase III subunit epsilon [Paraglaciecola chathamensis]|jgi:DNA polymerase-3 subunit epsilon|uniref:DNA polymerase III subunit epsilon n=1 Tax=Paraglaciecola chathamensis S18K6 TaxID=1127672 RepID=A0AAV3UZS5_9ALTE|nr:MULTISPECIES: DNA polymerase III subunit epsilon [Paraglaciecola]MBN24349.1 DNA polymerase III subunit epsilon [Alteromonadaceae bacterium]MDO6839295.1 DNA polymerase III subunit epsilon [Paraglaciecola chathamensis]GAC10229.1 DNA polymerase III subunit epsilon [Paraglaciecola chathamensis S18K6]|tara:strand:- start:139177 stop:139884 length:708 start_codon:yes stop_codon:yes gene_type:complete